MSLSSAWRAIIGRSQESPKTRPQRRYASRRRLARFELFEPRMMLSYTPLQVATAYGYNNIMYGSVVGNGAGQTVAIIDPGDDANFVNSSSPNFSKSDLAKFDADYGLPNPPSFKVVGEDGGARPTYASAAANNVDYGETAGDVEWVHALAPGANIVLIEETNSTASDRNRAPVDRRSSGRRIGGLDELRRTGEQQRARARPLRQAFRSRPPRNRATR